MKLLAPQILLLISFSVTAQIVSLPEGTSVFEKTDRFSNLLKGCYRNVEAVSSPMRGTVWYYFFRSSSQRIALFLILLLMMIYLISPFAFALTLVFILLRACYDAATGLVRGVKYGR